jgi:hypothetical protein
MPYNSKKLQVAEAGAAFVEGGVVASGDTR